MMENSRADSTQEGANGEQSSHSAPANDVTDHRPRRYFERPGSDARPLSFRETLIVVLSTHLGVRTRRQRQEDFQRANGLHLFIAGVIYFALLIGLLILLASYLSGSR